MYKKLVAVVVPLANRSNFTEDEKISIRHLTRYLASYDRYLIMPETLEINIEGFKEKRFQSNYFGSVEANRRLVFAKEFYEAFNDYSFVLIYHLDALVFSDQLTEWCRKGYDYIAPPWVQHKDAPYWGNSEYEGKVGNGGFSLRKTESFLKVITSNKLAQSPFSAVASAIRYGTSVRKYSALLKLFLYFHPRYNGVRNEMESYFQNEDHFWANRAAHYYPGFKVAPIEEAIKFAFECVPRYSFELNGRRLPFGCHAWNKYERDFWEPFLL